VEIQKLMSDFLWDGKPPKIKNRVMINDYADGGLKFPHFESYLKAQKASWICRI